MAKSGQSSFEQTSETGPASDGGAKTLSLVLLGGFEVSVGLRTIAEDEWRLRKAANLVKLLALTPGHRLHREQVMEMLWPDFTSRAAANNLHQSLHAARHTLEPGAATFRYLSLRGEQLVLCPGGQLWVDVDAFEETAAEARRSGDHAVYRAALDLYAGDLLPRDRYEEWAEGEPASDTPDSLSPRERKIADLVAQGLTNRQIAGKLSISERTVATHVGRILKKLGINSRNQVAARLAEERIPTLDTR